MIENKLALNQRCWEKISKANSGEKVVRTGREQFVESRGGGGGNPEEAGVMKCRQTSDKMKEDISKQNPGLGRSVKCWLCKQ